MKIRFLRRTDQDFYSVLKQRVENYFLLHHFSKYANAFVHMKSIGLILIACLLYATVFFELFTKPFLLLFAMLLSITKGMIGINISHDALHGAYSHKQSYNRWLGFTYDLIGLSSWVWKITHNYNHHVYTNILGMDHDIDKAILLRLSPKEKHYSFQRFQHWYIFFLYALTGLNWVLYSDYVYFFREAKKHSPSPSEIFLFFFFKAVNLTIFLLLPLIFMSLKWWEILIGYVFMQMVGGFVVALIFQLAHLVEKVQFPEPDEKGEIAQQWAIHEMATTSNFGTNNRFLNLICGGLNFQIEHHLFPNICHIHYKELSKIVRTTAQEFGIAYHENYSMTQAIKSHFKLLKNLGNPNS